MNQTANTGARIGDEVYTATLRSEAASEKAFTLRAFYSISIILVALWFVTG